jgi:hypothetical protein
VGWRSKGLQPFERRLTGAVFGAGAVPVSLAVV